MAKIILTDVKCSFVFVSEPRKNKENGDFGGWGIQPLLPKGSKQLKKLNKIIDKVLVDAKGESALKKKGMYKLPVRDGDEERDGEEYEGMVFMNANQYGKNKKPGMLNKNGEPADQDDIDEYCYSGAYFHVSMSVYYFKARDGGKPGVALSLNNVKFRKKGKRLDGSVSASNDFADFADEDIEDEDEDDFDEDDF